MNMVLNHWSRVVWSMRILCCVNFLFCLSIAYLAYRTGHPILLGIDAYCAGVSSVLTGFNWCILNPKGPLE